MIDISKNEARRKRRRKPKSANQQDDIPSPPRRTESPAKPVQLRPKIKKKRTPCEQWKNGLFFNAVVFGYALLKVGLVSFSFFVFFKCTRNYLFHYTFIAKYISLGCNGMH